jgi:hypothetical protein
VKDDSSDHITRFQFPLKAVEEKKEFILILEPFTLLVSDAEKRYMVMTGHVFLKTKCYRG